MMRKLATLAAMVFFLGQAIAAAHFHPASRQHEVASTTGAIADSSCAICAAHLHSPVAAAVAPALDAPKVLDSVVPCAIDFEPLSTFVRNCFGRAPPAAL